jgi:hypothetical protein
MKMNNWTADFTNDPNDDYNPIVEILCDGEEIAVIRKGKEKLEIKWYPNEKELIIPFKWLLSLLTEAEKRMQ